MHRHPALIRIARQQSSSFHARMSDRITAFSGSMLFVYLHIIWFTYWLICGLSINMLTMIVSLEAIFLSTFVLISQNRADKKRSAIADHDHEVDCTALELLMVIADHFGIEYDDIA